MKICPSPVCPSVSRLVGGGVYLRNASVTCLLFSSAVPSGSGDFSNADLVGVVGGGVNFKGEGSISEMLQ